MPQLAGRPLRSLQSCCSRHGPEGTPHIGRVELGAVSSGEHQLWSGGFTFGDLLPGDVYRRRSASGSGSSPSKSASARTVLCVTNCVTLPSPSLESTRTCRIAAAGRSDAARPPARPGSAHRTQTSALDQPGPDRLIGLTHRPSLSVSFMAGDFDAGDNRGSSSRGSNGGGAPFCAEQQQQRREHDQGVDGHEPTEQP